MKFQPGQLVVTRLVHDMMTTNIEFEKHVHLSIECHLAGDWGDVCDDDRVANELALQSGDRFFSAYKREGMPKLWIITEGDRSATTVLFPDEY
jgi:hypothetical protein